MSSKSSSKIKERKEEKNRKEAKNMFYPLTNRCLGGFERHRRTSGMQLQPSCEDMITTSPIVTAVIYLLVSSRILNIFSVF